MDHGDQVPAPSQHSSKSESAPIRQREGKLIPRSIPYAPFSKSDKITRIADWHDTVDTSTRGGRQGYTGQRRTREAYGASETNAFGYIHEEDEKSFSLVDSGPRRQTKARLPMGGRGRGLGQNRGTRGRGGFANRGYRAGGRGGYNDWNKVSKRAKRASNTPLALSSS